jgi:microcystin-dependent protein
MPEPFIGELSLWAGNTAIPTGWLECDGTQLQADDYLNLYTLIGTTFGGDAPATFNLPDLRGRVAIAAGTDGYRNSYAVGAAGGAESVTLTEATMPAHTHALTATTAAGSAATPAGNLLAATQNTVDLYRPTTPTALMGAGAIGDNTGGTAHENRQPFMAITYIMAYDGINPTF